MFYECSSDGTERRGSDMWATDMVTVEAGKRDRYLGAEPLEGGFPSKADLEAHWGVRLGVELDSHERWFLVD